MEIRIIVFLAFTSLTLITNALLLWFAYRAFAKVAMKATETISEAGKSAASREWVASLRVASENALSITEAVKRDLANFEPALTRAQSRYGFALSSVDTRFEKFERVMSSSLSEVNESARASASKLAAFAAGVKGVAARLGCDDGDS
jgi:hypothetical protein